MTSSPRIRVRPARLSSTALRALPKRQLQPAQAKKWRARKNGLQYQDEPAEVRNLTHDTEARAQAEAAMRLMGVAKPKRKPGGRW